MLSSEGNDQPRAMSISGMDSYSDGLDRSHAEKIRRVLAHTNDLGYNLNFGPLDAKDLGELLEVDGRSFANAVDVVAQPGHAQVAELLVEEGLAELSSQQRDVLDDGLSNAPGFVFRELDDRREQGLRKQINADD